VSILSTIATVLSIISTGTQLYSLYQSYEEEQQEAAYLENIRRFQMEQVAADTLTALENTNYRLMALSDQLEYARQATLLEQYERLKQGLRDVALHQVTQQAAGITSGATAKALQIESQVDTQKDVSIMKRNFLHVAKKLGLEKEAALKDLDVTIQNAARQLEYIQKAQSMDELALASQYRAYRAQLLSSAVNSAYNAYSMWNNS